jgi:2-polyprenyl-6-methoxyphenol hydroxylase-like FAD-dependent oxidoreductase
MNEILEIQQNNSTSILYDVIIVGAGPVGLFLASELALANCSVLVLEKPKSFSPLKKNPFGMRGLSAPSIELLYRRDYFQLTLHKKSRTHIALQILLKMHLVR